MQELRDKIAKFEEVEMTLEEMNKPDTVYVQMDRCLIHVLLFSQLDIEHLCTCIRQIMRVSDVHNVFYDSHLVYGTYYYTFQRSKDAVNV